jgi:hypothetical protein
MVLTPPNGPELSCGDEVPRRRNPVRASQVLSDNNWLFRASEIVDGWFRQLERLVRAQAGFKAHLLFPYLEFHSIFSASVTSVFYQYRVIRLNMIFL